MQLPIQKLAFTKKNEEWKKENVNFFDQFSRVSSTGNRTSNYRKAINYELFNGRFNRKDLEYVCNPLGLKDQEYPATLQHYDIISPAIMLLLGEEASRTDNFMAVSEGPEAVNRKTKIIEDKIIQSLYQSLMAEIDPNSLPKDPKTGAPQQPPTPEEIKKYEKYTPSDLVETKANHLLRILKKKLALNVTFGKGWKDALIAGEEIYWTGILNGEPQVRRCNPLNISVVLDADSDYIDDAVAVIESRLMTVPSILDEYGDGLSNDQITKLEEYAKNPVNLFTQNTSTFVAQENQVIDIGQNTGFTGLRSDNKYGLIRVVRVEWMSMKKIGTLTYTDDETGELITKTVDESFQIMKFKEVFPDAKCEWFWVNEPWEGIKIGQDLYTQIQPKQNQRRRLDNPYYAKLGYSGLIYNATNSVSISLIDRLKAYQYLYNILMYRLELTFASDMGKKLIMDLAQIPRSEGMDVDKWMYYLKAMNIVFVNSFEEGKKGAATGKFSNFNQFQAVDMSLGNVINQYISSLDFIRQQVAFLSGISPQRLGAVKSSELVGNVEKSIEQSSYITEYWFKAHNEVKRRVYTSLIECAKIAYRNGTAMQYMTDDMGIEMLKLDEFEIDNEEMSVFMTDSVKDQQILQTMKQLFPQALQADKTTLSGIVNSLLMDSPRELMHALKLDEQESYARQEQMQEKQNQVAQQQSEVQMQIHKEQLADKQADRDLEKYKTDSTNETKIQVAEISVYARQQELDQNNNGIPDPVELGKLSLEERDLASKAFMEQQKLGHEKDKHSREISLKEKEIASKKQIEEAKLKIVREQNTNQIQLADKKHKADKEMMDKKMEIEKMKAKAAIAKSKQKPKK